ncbi:MAG: hypothetical protein KDE28_09320, partial [Anaerolineales bacterium]|nr:hypothetical protein [Anaerolineales bacterium]
MSSHAVPASDQLLQELRQLLSEVLDADISAVDPELPLLDLITSSLAMVDGMRRVYDRFGVLISLRQLIEAQTTLGMLALQIQNELEKRRAQPAAAKVVSPAPPRQAEPLPLPAAQQHVAFLSRYMSQAAAAYNLAIRLQLSGPLDPTALRHALQKLVEQNEALRLALNPERDELLLLAADEPVLLPLPETSATTLQPLLAELINEPFAPGEVLFRAALLQIGPERHELLLVTHALALDETALAGLTGALGALYSAQQRDEPPVAAGAPLSWRQYQALAAGDAAASRSAAAAAYYRDLLPAGLPRFDLPIEQARPPVKRYEGASYRLPLSEIANSALQSMAAQLKLSPSILIAGALTLWLHR